MTPINRVHRRLSIEELEPRIAPAGTWVELPTMASADAGGISNNLGNSIMPSMAFGTDGNPIVAWTDTSSGNPEIYVRRWDGVQWAQIGATSATGGGISNNPGLSMEPCLAVGTNGLPVVAWRENSSLYVRYWNGSSWAEMGAGSASGTGVSTTAYYPSIAMGTDGNPVVAWVVAGGEIYVRRWDGASWVEIGAGSASGGGISQNPGYSNGPSVAVGTDGNPIVAWDDTTGGNYEIYVRRWNGSSWVEYPVGTGGSASGGGISGNTGSSSYPTIAIGGDGNPIVAWQDNSSVNVQIYVRRWNGSSWGEYPVGTSGSASGGGISNETASFFASTYGTATIGIGPDGNPIVAWETDYTLNNTMIHVRRWNGISWGEMGAQSASGYGIQGSGSSGDPVLGVNSNGKVTLAYTFRHPDTTYDIYARRWDGYAWVDYGTTGSATGGGLSSNAGGSVSPVVAFQPVGTEGNAIFAWADDSSGLSQIYVREWSGAAQVWINMGANSASGQGISSTGHATSPSIAVNVGGDNNPVIAWQDVDPIGGDTEIYVRKWNPALQTWDELGGSASNQGISGNTTSSLYPAVAFGTDGNPVVAWQDVDSATTQGDAEIYVRRWSGSAWVEMATGSATGQGISNNAGQSLRPTLAGFASASPIGTPVLGWYDNYGGQYEIYVREWSGTAWTDRGTPSGSGYIDASPAIAKNPITGTYMVAWQQGFSYTNPTNWEIYVRNWNGAAWDATTNASNNVGLSTDATIIIGTDGIPIVGWADTSSGSTQIYLRRYVGGAWVEMPTGGSAVGGGISGSTGLATKPRLSVGAHGGRYIAWEDSANGNIETYVRKWDGTPMIGSLISLSAFTNGDIMRPNVLTLTANAVQDLDGSVTQVEFWRDRDGDGILTTVDLLLARDTSGADGWYSTYYTSPYTFVLGTNTFFSRGLDNDGNWSPVTLATSRIVDSPPSLGSLTSAPNTVQRGATLTLTANSALDADGFVAAAEFYWDSNYNGVFDVGVDPLLTGSIGTSGAAWIWTGPTPAGIAAGNNVFFARARDNDGVYGNPAEPFTDSNGNGAWDAAEPFIDINANGVWNAGEPFTDVNQSGTYNAAEAFTDLYRNGKWDSAGTPVSTTVTVRNVAPTVDSLTYSPDPLRRTDTLTLTANGVNDADGSVARVEFWRDANGNGILDRGMDLFLSPADVVGTNGWAWTGGASIFPVGTNTFFAVAMDSDGARSSIVSVNGDVQDTPPQVASLADGPDPVKRTEMLTLTASGVTDGDGTIARVEFYRDVNTNGTIEIGTDTLLGADTSNAGGWSWTGPVTGFPAGTNQYLARAVDDAGQASNVVSTTGVVLETAAPAVTSLTDTPDPVLRPNDLTLTATGVTDSDGTVTQVQFYRDANGNGVLDVGIDTLLGTDTSTAGGWTWTGPTTSFPAGVSRFFARAQDNDLQWSSVVTTTTTVQNAAPVIASLSDGPDFVARPNALFLTANGVTDPDGSVTAVEYYRDRNGNGIIDVGIDTLLGASTGGWAWFGPTTSLPNGTNTFMARARDNDGQWSNTVATTNTIVTPVVINSGFSRTFMDADGDAIAVAMSGGGSAQVIFTASDFFSISVSGTTSRSTMTITDDRVGPGTLKLGAVTIGPGLNIGTFTIRSGSPNAVVSNTNIAADGNIASLSIGPLADGLDVTAGGSMGSAVFSRDVAHTHLTITGNLGTMTASGKWTDSNLQVSGKANSVRITGTVGDSVLGFSGDVTTLTLGQLNNSNVTLGGQANSVTLSGGMRNGARLDANGINTLSVSNGVDASIISLLGDVRTLKALGGMTSASSITVAGQAGTVTLSGTTAAPSLQAGSTLRVGSLKSSLTSTGSPLAGTVRVDGSAADSLIKITGDLTGSLFAGVFGNVTITGQFTGAIGDGSTGPGAGNTLRITRPGGGGILTPANAFATKIGYP